MLEGQRKGEPAGVVFEGSHRILKTAFQGADSHANQRARKEYSLVEDEKTQTMCARAMTELGIESSYLDCMAYMEVRCSLGVECLVPYQEWRGMVARKIGTTLMDSRMAVVRRD